mmetsp:Transcript_34578/g.52884  ORF Transcript_34578/g.52884 Transcript_34578/m.52884 type:complete len:127 (+) Transcript_34578:1155-1535(+)
MIERYDTVIVHFINKQQYSTALAKVTEIKDEAKRNDMMLRYASVFLNKCAKETIEELKRPQYKTIEIAKLMPSFMNICIENDKKHALEYLTNFCIGKRSNKSKTVHNMAFFFHSEINDPERMLKFL